MLLRAQSAMEYLTTYGWALLILGIVLVSLYALGVFNPANFSSSECVLNAGFSCLNFFIAQNGLFTVNLEQSTSDPINITAIGCNTNQTTVHMSAPLNPPTNQIYLQVGANRTFTVQCWTGPVTYSNTPGNLFTGYLVVNYTDEVTSLPNTIYGKLNVQVS